MSKIVQFNKGNVEEEENNCPFCELVSEFAEYIKDCDTESELVEILHDFANESSKLGVMNYLQQEITHKIELLDHLEYGDCEE
jgi:hypothetical protein